MKQFLIILSLTLSVHTLQAGFTGPGHSNTVQEVLANPSDDSYVVLKGFITHQLKDDFYQFKDSTGTIDIEIDEDDFPEEEITPETPIVIRGEVNKHFFRDPFIEAESLAIEE